MAAAGKPVLDVRGLIRLYGAGCPQCLFLTGSDAGTNICPQCHTIVACNNISFDLEQGEILGIVGESGSGKSTMLRCIYFDEESTAGECYFAAFGDGRTNAFIQTGQARRYIRNHLLGMVYQNPLMGIKPHFTAGGNVAEKLLTANVYNIAQIRQRADTLLQRTGVPLARMDDFPANFSGGEQQRVQIAKALANNPPVLLLDEITTGLDVSVQARVLDLIKEIQRDMGITMVVVSHDLGVIRLLADRTAVMQYGEMLECGLTDQILEDPQHGYTQLLVHSML